MPTVSGKVAVTSLSLILLLAGGCGRGGDGSGYQASASARRFPIAGVVRGSDATANQVTVAHEDIPGLMDAMTMTFAVKEPWVAKVANPGDRLTGTLVVDGTRSWIEGTSVTSPPQGTAADGAEAGGAGIGPAAGTPAPTAPLVDQAGRTLTVGDFAGRDVIVTFIYTHCPLPDYCPRMMARLNEAASRLVKAGRRDDVQMVAITVDPARDTPDVLAAYGKAHIDDEGDPFHRWSLLTGTPENIRTWAAFFALTYEPDGKEIAHGLRTAVLDRDGKVVGVLRGNEWTTNQLMALLPSR